LQDAAAANLFQIPFVVLSGHGDLKTARESQAICAIIYHGGVCLSTRQLVGPASLAETLGRETVIRRAAQWIVKMDAKEQSSHAK